MMPGAHGLVLHCDAQGHIVGIVRNDLGIEAVGLPGRLFSDLFNGGERIRAEAMLERVRTREAAFDWEIDIATRDGNVTLHFAGSLVGKKMLIAGARSLSAVVGLHCKHAADAHRGGAGAADHFDEISRMNNELVNLQRDFARSNAELEARVRERTGELEAAVRAAEAASTAKSRFLAAVSHDLRTPLHAILGFADVMQRDGRTAAAHSEALAAINASGRQLLDMINAMLEVAHQSRDAAPTPVPSPAATSAAGTPRRADVVGLAPGQPECRVLIAEDEPLNRAVLGHLLRDTGFAVREAEDGLAAVAEFEQWRPHFIWMDMRMPVMDGIAATRAIRARPGGGEVRIAAFTAHACPDNQEEMRAVGCDAVLTKPTRNGELFETMERLLGLRFTYAAGPPNTA